MEKLKLLVSTVLVFICFSTLQLQPLQAADDETQRKADVKVEEKRRLVEIGSPIPPIAQGYEAIYERFLNGALIYKPDPNSDVGMVTLLIRDLANPLDGTFDLSGCGDTGKYLSISTGYRKGKKPENANKVEIWFAPRFLIEKELNTTAKHFQPIFGKWEETAEVGMFWTWGGYGNMDWYDGGYGSMDWYDYLTTENMDNLSKINLYENWKNAASPDAGEGWWGRVCWLDARACGAVRRWVTPCISCFFVHFAN